jgi:hypothetical protein
MCVGITLTCLTQGFLSGMIVLSLHFCLDENTAGGGFEVHALHHGHAPLMQHMACLAESSVTMVATGCMTDVFSHF